MLAEITRDFLAYGSVTVSETLTGQDVHDIVLTALPRFVHAGEDPDAVADAVARGRPVVLAQRDGPLCGVLTAPVLRTAVEGFCRAESSTLHHLTDHMDEGIAAEIVTAALSLGAG